METARLHDTTAWPDSSAYPGARPAAVGAPRSTDIGLPAWALLSFGAALVAALVLRVVALDASSFTRDEAYNVWAVASPDRYFASFIVDHHPPVWYAVLGMWTGLFGTSDLMSRGSSVAAGLLFIVAVAALAHRAAGPRTAAWAALLAAVWPLAVEQQRLVLMYAWLPAASAAAALGLVEARRSGGRWPIAAGLALAALAGVHVMGALAAGGLLVGATRLLPLPRLRGVLVAGGLAFAPAAYLTTLIAGQMPGGSRGLGPGSYLQLAAGLSIGLPPIEPALVLSLAAMVIVPALFGVVRGGAERPLFAGLLTFGIALPVLLAAVALNEPLIPHYFIAGLPVLVVGLARWSARAPTPAAAAIVVLLLASSALSIAAERSSRVDWRAIAAQLERETTDESWIAAVPSYSGLPLARYYSGPLKIEGYDPRPSGIGPLAFGSRDILRLSADAPLWLVIDTAAAEPASELAKLRADGSVQVVRIAR